MAKDKNFFDTESPIYSAKRYVDKPVNYIQFFFKERLRLTIKLISKTFNGKNNLSFLDIGCADGIVVDEIAKAFPTIFSSFIGIDTAPAMIAVAVKKYAGKPYVFKVRDDFSDISEKDVIVET